MPKRLTEALFKLAGKERSNPKQCSRCHHGFDGEM
jgi:hypothetical protein